MRLNGELSFTLHTTWKMRSINTITRYYLSPEQQSEGTAVCYFCLRLELISIS